MAPPITRRHKETRDMTLVSRYLTILDKIISESENYFSLIEAAKVRDENLSSYHTRKIKEFIRQRKYWFDRNEEDIKNVLFYDHSKKDIMRYRAKYRVARKELVKLEKELNVLSAWEELGILSDEMRLLNREFNHTQLEEVDYRKDILKKFKKLFKKWKDLRLANLTSFFIEQRDALDSAMLFFTRILENMIRKTVESERNVGTRHQYLIEYNRLIDFQKDFLAAANSNPAALRRNYELFKTWRQLRRHLSFELSIVPSKFIKVQEDKLQELMDLIQKNVEDFKDRAEENIDRITWVVVETGFHKKVPIDFPREMGTVYVGVQLAEEWRNTGANILNYAYSINWGRGTFVTYECIRETARQVFKDVLLERVVWNAGLFLVKLQYVKKGAFTHGEGTVNFEYTWASASRPYSIETLDGEQFIPWFDGIVKELWQIYEYPSEESIGMVVRMDVSCINDVGLNPHRYNTQNLDMGTVMIPDKTDFTTVINEDDYETVEGDNELYEVGSCEESRGRKFVLAKRYVQSVKGKDGSCFFAAVDANRWHRIHKRLYIGSKTGPELVLAARKWIQDTYGIIEPGGVDWRNTKYYELFLGLSITIRIERNGVAVILYPGAPDIHDKVEIFLHDGHYLSDMGEPGGVVIGKKLFCPACNKIYAKDGGHVCPDKICPDCHRAYKNKHVCTNSRLNLINASEFNRNLKHRAVECSVALYNEDPSDCKTIAYDLECKEVGSQRVHVPYNCCVYFSKDVWAGPSQSKSFYGLDCIERFLDWLDELPESDYKIVGFNSSKYDNHFLISEIVARKWKQSMVIQNDSVITKIEIKLHALKSFVFLDLLKFFGVPCSLRDALTSYNVPATKGHFPFKFLNEVQDIYYVGEIPARKYWENPEKKQLLKDEDWDEINDEIKEVFDLEEYNTKYCLLDAEATYKLHLAIGKTWFEMFKIRYTNYLTLSHLCWGVWTLTKFPNTKSSSSSEWNFEFPRPKQSTQKIVYFPDFELYTYSWESVRGGRVVVNNQSFESDQFEDIESGKIKYEDVTHYVWNLDTVSLYPHAMKTLDCPVGPYRKMSEDEIKALNDMLDYLRAHEDFNFYSGFPPGIYDAKVTPGADLVTPVLARKEFKTDSKGKYTSNGLAWTLEAQNAKFNHLDLELAVENGYYVEINTAIIWDDTSPLFDTFIDIMFKMKTLGDETKNLPMRNTAKNGMNSLYGKMCQKVIFDDHIITNNEKELWNFARKRKLTDIITLRKDIQAVGCIVKGVDLEKAISHRKPTYLGSMILGNSRKIMYRYYKIYEDSVTEGGYATRLYDSYVTDKEFISLSLFEFMLKAFCYGDTDSEHIVIYDKEHEAKLKKYVKPGQLGWLDDDIKGGGKIIQAIWVAPKTLYYKYINPKNEIKTVVKCKGMPHYLLDPKYYFCVLEGKNPEEEFGASSFEIFKKMGTHPDIDKEAFAIFSKRMERSFNKSFTETRIFLDEVKRTMSVPDGFKIQRNH